MTTVNIELLCRVGIQPTQAKRFAAPLADALAHFGITHPNVVAAVIGQCRVESIEFSRLEEGLFYSTPQRLYDTFRSRWRDRAHSDQYLRNPQALANFVYANRYGNGGPETGDGWKYRGSGLIQLTFKDNFAAAAKGTGRPYVEQPQLIRENPSDAALTAVWYFVDRGCDKAAERGDWDTVTRLINPAMLESKKRTEYTLAALKEIQA